MADCIDALITANIKAAIETITIANLYNTNYGAVDEKRSEFSLDGISGPFTLLEKLPRDLDSDYQHTDDSTLQYMIYYFNGRDDTENGSQPIQYRDRNVAADFQKALNADRTRGGYAQFSYMVSSGHDMYFQQGFGVSIPKFCTWMLYEVQRLVDATNPYLLA